MPIPGNLAEFRRTYQDYSRSILEPAAGELRRLLLTWKGEQYWAGYLINTEFVTGLSVPSPIRSFDVRIKRPESVEDKIRRHPDRFPEGWSLDSVRRMDDALGVRVVVHFLSDLALVHNELFALTDRFAIASDPQPVAYLPSDLFASLRLPYVRQVDKPSGYTSIHYRIQHHGARLASEQRPWFELQLRTLVQDAWAEIEHLVGYKAHKDTKVAVEDETRLISGHLRVIDQHFDLLQARLMRAQQSAEPPADHHRLNPENLPLLLQELDLLAAQREIDGLLRALASHSVATVGDFRARLPRDRKALIEKEWSRVASRDAGTFDIIGLAGQLKADSSDEFVAEQVRGWVELANQTRHRHDNRPLDDFITTLTTDRVNGCNHVRGMALPDHLSVIETQWQEALARSPHPLEIVAVLALLRDDADAHAVADLCHFVLARRFPVVAD
jgi:ppGpp synthetase/RelA/SpoT-type nucleotidyltranferase